MCIITVQSVKSEAPLYWDEVDNEVRNKNLQIENKVARLALNHN